MSIETPNYWGPAKPPHWETAIFCWKLTSEKTFPPEFSSQCGQDAIVEAAATIIPLSYLYPKTFVDIGANDGHNASSTFSLEQRGWTGLLVEPNIDLIPELIQYRKSPIISAAVGEEHGIGYLNYADTVDGLGTLVQNHDSYEFRRLLHEAKLKSQPLKKTPCPTITMSSLMECFHKLYATRLLYLKIDVEGFEINVVQQLSCIDKDLRPSIIEIENNQRRSDSADVLTSLGYTCSIVLDSFVEIWLDRAIDKSRLLSFFSRTLSYAAHT